MKYVCSKCDKTFDIHLNCKVHEDNCPGPEIIYYFEIFGLKLYLIVLDGTMSTEKKDNLLFTMDKSKATKFSESIKTKGLDIIKVIFEKIDFDEYKINDIFEKVYPCENHDEEDHYCFNDDLSTLEKLNRLGIKLYYERV